MTYNEVLSHFTVKQKHRDKAQCICPAHNDREASLTVSKGDKGTVIYCHAGCETEKVLGAVGLSVRDLFEDDPIQSTGERWRAYVEGREKRQIEGVYRYVDLNGNYAFTRLRLSGKKFIYGIMDGDRFNYGLRGKSRKSIPAVFCESLQGLQTAIEKGQRIFYCEGEKDVRTVNSHGLTGVTCGASGDWVSDCSALFQGADVVILQDNDQPGEKSARSVEKDLRSVARSVRIVVPTPDLDHGDISDFFKDHTVGDLEALLKEKQPEPEEKPGELDLDQFHIIKNGRITGVFDFAILQYLKKHQDLFVLGGVVYLYKDGVFRPDRSGAELKTMIRKLIYPEFIKSTTVKRVFDLFISDAELQVTTEDLNQYPVEWVNFQNGFYDPVSRTMTPHDPVYRATVQIPHVYNPDDQLSGTMVQDWLSFICQSPEDLEMLLQFSGLCLTRDCRQQKFMILNGEGGTGKSVVIRMIETMIGTENISNISLSQLTQRFAPFGLLGKLLNSCADLEISALEDTSVVKKVLGEDTLRGEAKGKDSFSFRSFAKLIFSTNQLPVVKGEQTNGFYRRLLILTMDKVPLKKESDFFDRLSAEVDDFILLSVQALERLYQTGQIVESPGSVEAVKRLRCDSDTVEAFLTERVEKVPDSTENRIKKSDLYRSYEEFCRDMERQSLTKQNFYRSMKTKGFSEVKTKTGTECFRGLKYRENLRENSADFSVSGWKKLNGERTPFDWAEKQRING